MMESIDPLASQAQKNRLYRSVVFVLIQLLTFANACRAFHLGTGIQLPRRVHIPGLVVHTPTRPRAKYYSNRGAALSSGKVRIRPGATLASDRRAMRNVTPGWATRSGSPNGPSACVKSLTVEVEGLLCPLHGAQSATLG